MSLESGLFSAQRPFVRGGLSCAPAACLPACLLLLPPPGSCVGAPRCHGPIAS
eukprot:COSAG01_NODE_3058_length_6654_cov_3.122636_6_plen_53_part_00